MPTFVGLDLAWTAHHESGICWFAGETPEDLRCTRIEAAVRDTESLAEEIATAARPAVVAIDAPLLYAPTRSAEREIARRFGRYKASPHQAHHAVQQGRTAGIDLGKALKARGFTLDPAALLDGAPADSVAIEVYPHTIHVRLFRLRERLPYKARPRRSVAFRRGVMRQYQEYLRGVLEREAPGVLDNPDVLRTLAPETATNARGVAFKRLEDTLDGLTCALAAWLTWRNPRAWETIGDLTGYIVAPRAQDALPL